MKNPEHEIMKKIRWIIFRYHGQISPALYNALDNALDIAKKEAQ